MCPTKPNLRGSSDPNISVTEIMKTVRDSGLTWGSSETPYSLFLTVRKRYLKSSLTGATRCISTTPLVVEGERSAEGLQVAQGKLKKLQSDHDRLKAEYDVLFKNQR